MSEANLRSGYALRLDGITRRFRSGEETLEILSGADFDLVAGEIVALVAPSGTGKSTLLHLAGLLEAPSEGRFILATGLQVVWGRQHVLLCAVTK